MISRSQWPLILKVGRCGQGVLGVHAKRKREAAEGGNGVHGTSQHKVRPVRIYHSILHIRGA